MNVMMFLIVLAQASSRAVWIAAGTGDAAPCAVEDGRWRCPRPDAARGIVVLIGDDRVRIVSADGVDGVDPSTAQWGRLVRVEAGGAAINDVHDLVVSAWTPERSAVRTNLKRFRALRDQSVHVLKLAPTVFWVAGAAAIDPDAFLAIEGPHVGALHVATSRLREDAPEVPFVIQAPMRLSIAGRVRNARGEDVTASVELLRPLRAGSDRPPDAETPVIAVASAIADADGSFVFDGTVDAPLLVAAASPVDGRGSAWVMDTGPPVVIDLIPPLRAHGRVLRHRMPLAGARIRFVPNIQAWGASVNPAANLAAETASADDGVFEIVLPEQSTGELQIVAADGVAARVPIADAPVRARTIELGDVVILDPRRIVVRLLEPLQSPPCDLLAIGPLDRLGMQIVRASSSVNVYTLDLPESGRWTFSADCGGHIQSVAPTIATVPSAASDSGVPTIDLRFVR
jgi:hypothetical protein